MDVVRTLRNCKTRLPLGKYKGSLICKMVWVNEQRVYLQRLCQTAIETTLREQICYCLRLRQECILQKRKKQT